MFSQLSPETILTLLTIVFTGGIVYNRIAAVEDRVARIEKVLDAIALADLNVPHGGD